MANLENGHRCRAPLTEATEATIYSLEAAGKVPEKFRSNFYAEFVLDTEAGETSDYQDEQPSLEIPVDFTREDTARVSIIVKFTHLNIYLIYLILAQVFNSAFQIKFLWQ